MNVISIGTDINLTWDNHLLKSYNDIQHKYDKATARRTQKQINGIQTKYWYNDSNQLIYEETENEYIRYQYDLNRNLIRLVAKANNKIYKFNLKRDILENILGLIDENTKEEVIKYEYDSYEIVKISGSLKDIAFKLNKIIYKGYYYDEETNLFYCNSRYYSPELCGFISPDSIEYLDLESING